MTNIDSTQYGRDQISQQFSPDQNLARPLVDMANPNEMRGPFSSPDRPGQSVVSPSGELNFANPYESGPGNWKQNNWKDGSLAGMGDDLQGNGHSRFDSDKDSSRIDGSGRPGNSRENGWMDQSLQGGWPRPVDSALAANPWGMPAANTGTDGPIQPATDTPAPPTPTPLAEIPTSVTPTVDNPAPVAPTIDNPAPAAVTPTIDNPAPAAVTPTIDNPAPAAVTPTVDNPAPAPPTPTIDNPTPAPSLTPSLVSGMTETFSDNLVQNGTTGFDTNGVNDVQGQGTGTTWSPNNVTDTSANIATTANGVAITDDPSNMTSGTMTLNQTVGGNGQDYYVQVTAEMSGSQTNPSEVNWAGAWMLPQSATSPDGTAVGAMETDIVESGFLGTGANNEQDAYHYHTISGATVGGVANISSDIPNNSSGALNMTNSYNTYGVEVTPGENIYYFDGQEVGTAATDPSLINTPQKLILTSGIPNTSDSSWHAPADTSTAQTTFSNVEVFQS